VVEDVDEIVADAAEAELAAKTNGVLLTARSGIGQRRFRPGSRPQAIDLGAYMFLLEGESQATTVAPT